MKNRTNSIRIGLGLAIWAFLVGGSWWAIAGRGSQSLLPDSATDQLWGYASGHRRSVALQCDFTGPLTAGDPIFVIDSNETVRQVGEVSEVSRNDDQLSGTAVFYWSGPPIDQRTRLTFHETPASMAWVLETMFPEEKRQAVSEELSSAFASHHDEIVTALRPVIENGLRDAFHVLEQDLPTAVERHREQITELGDRYQREIVQSELVPLVKEEIWPIVQRHAEPTVTEVGQEIWQRASLWRFGWRYAYDRSPFPQKQLAKKEWQRFVDEEAVPVLEDHIDDFVLVQQKILSDVAKHPEVRDAARETLGRVLKDPELQRITWEIIQEVVVENPRMRDALRKQWQSDEAERAFRIASARLEPTAVRIGELLLGTPENGVTPEFARVLRNQVLRKDQRWLVLETSVDTGDEASTLPESLVVSLGDSNALHPFVRSTSVLGTRP